MKAANNRAYRLSHREALRAYHREWFAAKWRESQDFRTKNRTRVSKKAHAAHQRVLVALRRGQIVRPAQCEACGVEAFVEAAHTNYDEWMAIRWLCRPCHRRWDCEQPKGALEKAS